MAAPYILARTLRDAHDFAREELGLSRGQYRVVTSPSTLSGRRGTDLYLVPGYENRHDRFAMRGAIRYTRLNVIDVEKQAEEPETDGLTPAGTQPELHEGADPALVAEFEAFLNGSAEHPHEQAEEPDAHEFVAAGVAEEETAGTPESAAGDPIEPDETPLVAIVTDGEHETEESLRDAATEEIAEALEPTPADDSTKRRRRRCKECGVLVEPDDVEQHAADHLPTEQ